MRHLKFRQMLPTLALLCAGCAGQAAQPPAQPAIPSPTIAGAQPQAAITSAPRRPTPTTASAAGQPTAAPAAPAAEPSVYLWPTYLPPDMRPSPSESRVAREGDVGNNGFGFYIVTLNSGQQKLSIGGGDIEDVLPLAGDERRINAGTRSGKLITSGEQREIVLDVARGKLFVYSSGLSEEQLLKVAASLQPVDVQTLRDMVGTK